MQTKSSQALSPQPKLAPPKRIGRYLLLDQIGAGGMGVVHRARDEISGATVAIKQLYSAMAKPAQRLQLEALFELEYHTLVRLKHPRIIEVYDYGLSDEGPYYTMELLDGSDLHRLAPLPYREACRYLRDVASSLALLHAHRLVHRDVTVRNVRLTSDGRAKLIDFGGLAAFGPAKVLVGTPACVAPESLSFMPLDQRTDLFSLGVIAYWALTGQYPYPARSLAELPALWQSPIARPAELTEGIPPALDALVMWLLKVDPMSRPAGTALVIDQLTAIGELEPEQHELAAQSYLQSSRMVGRQSEQQWMDRKIAGALEGKGGVVVIAGRAGIGKTRLFHELCLEAQLKGMVPLKADAEASPGAFGVAIALGSSLLSGMPESALRVGRPLAGWLGHLAPELHEQFGQIELFPLSNDLAERRARLQAALHAWFLGGARERPLLLAVDNVQSADDGSAVFLSALSREAEDAKLLLLVTERSGDAPVAPVPLRLLRQRSNPLKLGPIDDVACQELVTSLFGDAPNSGRMAKLLHEKSAGNPQQCLDLVQLLVRKRIVKYVNGMWVLPLDVASDELPSVATEIAAARLAALSPRALALAQVLGIHRKPLPLYRCIALSEAPSESETMAALDELVQEQILVGTDATYHFGQQSVRDAVIVQTQASRLSDLHRRSGEALLESVSPSSAERIEAGWHLLQAGEDERGADLMAQAFAHFWTKKELAQENAEDMVRGLQAALEVYERRRSKYHVAGLLFALLQLAWYTDWRVIDKHGTRALDLGFEITGLKLAQRLARFLGRKLGLLLGLAIATIRLAPHRRRGVDYNLREAIGSVCSIVPACLGFRSITLDVQGVMQIRAQLAPLELFGEPSILWNIYDVSRIHELLVKGRFWEALQMIERHSAFMHDPKLVEMMGEATWKGAYGGLRFAAAIPHAGMFGTRALDIAQELDELGVLIWKMGADQIRLLYHACRGESEQARHYRDRVELYAVQGNTTWQSELLWTPLLMVPDMLAGDTIAVRRAAEQLARVAQEIAPLQVYADAAQAAYLSLRGDLSQAIALFEALLPRLPIRGSQQWLTTRAFLAQALNWAGQHKRAKQLLDEALACTPPEESPMVLHCLEPQRQLALAEAGLGNHAQATSILDRLLSRHGHEDNALLLGLLHKARAEVALVMGDDAAFHVQLTQMEQRFKATSNPALISAWQKLADKGRSTRSSARRDSKRSAESAHARQSAHRTLSQLSLAVDRHEYAVKLVMEKARAHAGYLYLFESGSLRLVAASSPNEPPRDVEGRLLHEARCAQLATPGVEAAAAGLFADPIEGDTRTLVEEMESGVQQQSSLPQPGDEADSLTVMEPASLVRRSQHARPKADDEDALTLTTPAKARSMEPARQPLPNLPVQMPPGNEGFTRQAPARSVAGRSVLFFEPRRARTGSYRLLLLTVPGEGAPIVVGGFILDCSAGDVARIEPALLAGIAQALYAGPTASLGEHRNHDLPVPG